MILETVTLTLPSKDTPLFGIRSSYIADRKQKFIAEGKMIRETTLDHPDGITKVTARLFRDNAARLEWWSDPIVLARSAMARDHNERNKIKLTTVAQTF